MRPSAWDAAWDARPPVHRPLRWTWSTATTRTLPLPGQRDVGLRGASGGGGGQASGGRLVPSAPFQPGVSKALWAARGHLRVWGLLFLHVFPSAHTGA